MVCEASVIYVYVKYYLNNRERKLRDAAKYRLKNPDVIRARKKRYYEANKGDIRSKHKDYRLMTISSFLLTAPVLGIPLRIGKGTVCDNSPSLDKIVPELGYVKGNVIVVSNRANRIKSDATLEEVCTIAGFMEEWRDKDLSFTDKLTRLLG